MFIRDHSKKVILESEALAKITEGFKLAGARIVTTIGSWDMVHIGHGRYLRKAKEFGDILIAGVDSDRTIKLYKDPLRPMVPEKERMEMLSYFTFVDIITLIDDVDEKGKWQYELLKIVKPDVFVAVEDSYPPEQIEDIKNFVDDVQVLSRQAETSTSNMIRRFMREFLNPMVKHLKDSGLLKAEDLK
jgi:D-beta-D-heptose 7-phosphate kinase/D-beta-D-heptose 1-phosphate adenosyltransferase